MQISRITRNTLLLTASSLLLSSLGMWFQAWLAGRIGAAGIGLYQLTLSVVNLGATFAISGIRFASTRLIAEELGRENHPGIPAAMGRCLGYAAFFGLAAALILYFLAEPLGFLWIGDARTVRSLRIAAWSLPCISLGASLSGYFTACTRVWKPTLVHLLEELFSIGMTALLLRGLPAGDLEKSCAAVTLGRLAADLFSLLLMLLFFLGDLRRYRGGRDSGGGVTARMLRIAVPLAFSAYARSALTTMQQLLVPRGLKRSGYSANGALAGYGVVQGMALPLALFPACLMAAAAELIVPELTAAQVRRDRAKIRRTAAELLRSGLFYSAAVAVFLFVFADKLAMAVYHSADAGRYLRMLAPLVPVMYTDMCVDGCLKGLGQQLWSMGVNILDGALGLLTVWLALPRWGLGGYLAAVYLTELVNFALSLGRLLRVLHKLPEKTAAASLL